MANYNKKSKKDMKEKNDLTNESIFDIQNEITEEKSKKEVEKPIEKTTSKKVSKKEVEKPKEKTIADLTKDELNIYKRTGRMPG